MAKNKIAQFLQLAYVKFFGGVIFLKKDQKIKGWTFLRPTTIVLEDGARLIEVSFLRGPFSSHCVIADKVSYGGKDNG